MNTINSVVPAQNPSSDSITLCGVTIHKSANGLYLLTDLWKAGGGSKNYQPNNWLKLEGTKKYINHLARKVGALLNQDVIEVINGDNGGTYVCKKLVYRYAMWVSDDFHDLVIDTFDQLATATTQQEVNDLKHRLDNSLQGDMFSKWQSPRDPHCLQVIMKCSPFQANQYHNELVGKGILGFREVILPPRRVYYARQQHPAVIGYKGETVLFDPVELEKVLPKQTDIVEFAGFEGGAL